MNSESASSSSHNNPFTFCFVEETGGNLDRSARTTIRSHAAREVRRRQRVKQLKGPHKLPLAAKVDIPASEGLAQAPSVDPHTELLESSSARQRSGFQTIGSGYQVDNAQTYHESLPKEIAHRRLPSPISATMSFGFDPFSSMAELSPLLSLNYSKEINTIKSHAINFCFPGNTKLIVFPEAVRTPALLGSILFMAYANLSSVRGWSNPELALALKTAAISHVNKKLSHPSTATCTNVIASIAYLSTGTWIFGDERRETATHLNGLQMMVQKRGMKSLGVYMFGQTIRKYLFIQHVVMQAMSAQPSHDTFHFDDDLGNGALASTTSMPKTNPTFLGDVFVVPHNWTQLNGQTTSVLLSTKSLIHLLLAQNKQGDPYEDETIFSLNFHSLKNQIESHLSAYDLMCPRYGDFTYEAVRLSRLLIIEAIETRKTLNQTSQLTCSYLSSALKKTDLSHTWGDVLGVLYWVSMIGSAAWKGRGGKAERLMDSTFGSTMFKTTFKNLDPGYAIRPARLFGRLQMALKRRSEMGALLERK